MLCRQLMQLVRRVNLPHDLALVHDAADGEVPPVQLRELVAPTTQSHRDAEPVDPFLPAGCKLCTRCSTVLDGGLLVGDAVFVHRVVAVCISH